MTFDRGMRFIKYAVGLAAVSLLLGCGGGGGDGKDSGDGSYQRATIKLEPMSVMEGRVFEWEAEIQSPVSPVVSVEWEQVTGVPIKILEGSFPRLVAEAPFVPEPREARISVRVTDDRGTRVEATSTVLVQPHEPTYVTLAGVVDLPGDVLPFPASVLEFATVIANDLEIPADSDFPLLAIARDADGWVLLAAANRHGGLLRDAQGQVVFSVDSTAVVLMALAAWEPIPWLTADRVEQMRSSPAYPRLTAAIESLLRVDKNFVERIGQYPDLLIAIERAVAGIPVQDPLTTIKSQTRSASQWIVPFQVARGYGEEESNFYCVPLLRWPCSPWNADQPWLWFGTARGAEVFLPESAWSLLGVGAGLFVHSPAAATVIAGYISSQWVELIKEGALLPFLARSSADYPLHALANPNYINYAFEAYSGEDRRFWMLAPRNATVLAKLRNSGAAKREERAAHDGRLSPDIDRIAFQRYRLTLSSQGEFQPDHAAVVSFLNLLSMSVAVANLITDASAVLKALEEVDAEDSVNLALCAAGFLAGEDIYFDARMSGTLEQTQDFIKRYALSVIRHVVTSEACGNVAVKGGKRLAEVLKSAKLMAVLDATANKLTLGAKTAFDSVNDLAPVATSFFSVAAAGVEYYLEWDEHRGQPYIHRVTTTKTPGATFSATPLSGTQVRLDASASSHDPSTSLRYLWGLLSDFADSGYRVIGDGVVLTYDFPLPGTYIVQLTVTDGYGLTDMVRSTVEVDSGRRPVIGSLRCSIENEQLHMQLDLIDPDQRATVIHWFADAVGTNPDRFTSVDVREVLITVPGIPPDHWGRADVYFDSGGESVSRTCWSKANDMSAGVTRHLNDTGIDWCADGSNNFLICPVAGYPGQDGEFGRDAAARAGTLQKDGAGSAGFDFTKIANNGAELPASASLGNGPNDWACTRDNVTGLIWEVKVDDPLHLRHKGHTYTWYDPESPDGNPGTQNGGFCAGSSCDTTGLVQAVNTQGLCGSSDWRMPTRRELQGIVNYGQFGPAIDTAYFPNTPSKGFWSGSPVFWPGPFNNDPYRASDVNFENGFVDVWPRSLWSLVRLVRGGHGF